MKDLTSSMFSEEAIQFQLQCWTKLIEQMTNSIGIVQKVLILGLKSENQLQNKNHTEDWPLGSHPRGIGYVTH